MKTVYPGQTVGVLGGGQLGRMFALAAQQLGFRVCVMSPEMDSPAVRVADSHIVGDFLDERKLTEFAQQIDVATIEFENIPVAGLQSLAQLVPVHPGPAAVRTFQDRIVEKTFVAELGCPTARFRIIQSSADLTCLQDEMFPAILKTAANGYDGKGQRMVHTPVELVEVWNLMGNVPCILESFVDFSCEFSVIAARTKGEFAAYAPIRNDHRHHVLDVSQSPSGLDKQVEAKAIEMIRTIAEALDYVGVLCVEFFLGSDGNVVVNEVAPRPHNSGHLTIEAHATSQFEQQVRAVCGLPLGSVEQRQPAAMANLLGDLWLSGEPHWERPLGVASTHLHLYGKDEARVGRKMGHLTVTSDRVERAVRDVCARRDELVGRSSPEKQSCQSSASAGDHGQQVANAAVSLNGMP